MRYVAILMGLLSLNSWADGGQLAGAVPIKITGKIVAKVNHESNSLSVRGMSTSESMISYHSGINDGCDDAVVNVSLLNGDSLILSPEYREGQCQIDKNLIPDGSLATVTFM